MSGVRIPASEMLRRRLNYHERMVEILQDQLSAAAVAEHRWRTRPRNPRGGRPWKINWVMGRKLWEKGMPVAEIAKVLSCRRNQVYRHADAHRWPTPSKRRRRVRQYPPQESAA